MTKRTPKKLRCGFTTGAAAAAAAKGALTLLLSDQMSGQILDQILDREPDQTLNSVEITFLTGEKKNIAIHTVKRVAEDTAVCTVIKDAGDDPDITHRAVIGARVTVNDVKSAIGRENEPGIDIDGGEGVGRVTLPGLEVPPGQAAINSGPRKMIRQEIMDVLNQYNNRQYNKRSVERVRVEVFMPEGAHLAQKTLNPRLGIVGGLSILGTTGIERPMSHEAYIATIRSALSVARAASQTGVVFTTGRRSERFAQTLWPHFSKVCFVQIGDFFKESLTSAARQGFGNVTLAVFFAKAVKMAQGVPHTHAARSDLSMARLSKWALAVTGDHRLAQQIRTANTARHAFDMLQERHQPVIHDVGDRMVAAARGFAGKQVAVKGVIFDYSGAVVYDSAQGPLTIPTDVISNGGTGG